MSVPEKRGLLAQEAKIDFLYSLGSSLVALSNDVSCVCIRGSVSELRSIISEIPNSTYIHIDRYKFYFRYAVASP